MDTSYRQPVSDNMLPTETHLYHTLVQNFSNFSVIVFNQTLDFLLVDGQDFPNLGVTRLAAGKSFYSVFPLALTGEISGYFNAALLGQKNETELYICDQILLLRIAPIYDEDGKIGFGMAVLQEITDRKHTDKLLRERDIELAQAKERAVTEERSRLADKLHDAVSQTLWSAGLIVDVLPTLQKQQPARVYDNLETLRQLIRSALAEMRTLLLDMRPDALADGKLSQAFNYLIDAFIGRTEILVAAIIDNDDHLPAEARIAFYQVVQEALNNIERHAAATQVSVQLSAHNEIYSLIIADNGRGFDLENSSGNHMGLRIMSERVHSIGAMMEIESSPEQGTKITITYRSVPYSQKDQEYV